MSFSARSCHLLVYLLTACSFLRAEETLPPAAVVVCGPGYESGHRFAAGDSAVNRSPGEELFILRAEYQVITVPPGVSLRLDSIEPKATPKFEESARALVEFARHWEDLHAWLLMHYPDSLPPDTVENFLVYPLNARLLDHPEAFKWQGDSLNSRFALYPADSSRPVFEEVTNQGRVKREQVESLIVPGSRYLWKVRTGERQDSAWFQVLTDSQLMDLGNLLETMDDLERQDNEGKRGPRAWTWLKAALLVERGLYYEARELIRGSWIYDRTNGPFYRELLRRVRYMQLFSGVFKPGP